MKVVTPAQQRLYDAIRVFKDHYGYAPSVRELGESVGLAISTVHHHLGALERAGLVTREPHYPRTLVIVEPPEESDDHPLQDLPQPDPGDDPAPG